MAYLRQRGIDTPALQSAWVIGYAPPGWTRLVETLSGEFPEHVLLDAGLARRSSRGSLIDTFRDRVLFGIRDRNGDLAGFIGRDLSGNAGAPKYLNTHQHLLFDKGTLLYGLHEGADSRHAPRQPVVVEGPLDVLAIASRPDGNQLWPVAACGTAFTADHASHIARIAFEHEMPVVVAMDGDAAGRTAALAAGERLRRTGLVVRIAALPNGVDPAEYLAGPGAMLDRFRVDGALPLVTAQVQNAIAVQGDRMQWVEGRLGAARSVASYLATYPASFTARQVGWLADVLELDASTVTFELVAAYRHSAVEGTSPRLQPAKTHPRIGPVRHSASWIGAERRLVTASPDLGGGGGA